MAVDQVPFKQKVGLFISLETAGSIVLPPDTDGRLQLRDLPTKIPRHDGEAVMRLTCPTCRAAPHGAVNCHYHHRQHLLQKGRDRALHSCPRLTHGQTTLDLEQKGTICITQYMRLLDYNYHPHPTTSNGERGCEFCFLGACDTVRYHPLVNLNLARRLGHRQCGVSNAQTFQVASEMVAKPIDNGARGVVIAAGPNPFLTNLHHSILYILNARDDLPGTFISSVAAGLSALHLPSESLRAGDARDDPAKHSGGRQGAGQAV